MMLPKRRSFLMYSYAQTNSSGLRGEPVERTCLSEESECFATGS